MFVWDNNDGDPPVPMNPANDFEKYKISAKIYPRLMVE